MFREWKLKTIFNRKEQGQFGKNGWLTEVELEAMKCKMAAAADDDVQTRKQKIVEKVETEVAEVQIEVNAPANNNTVLLDSQNWEIVCGFKRVTSRI